MNELLWGKINAYGFRKQGTKAILEILDSAQGYARRIGSLQKLTIKRSISERTFNNGLTELKNVEFIQIIKDDDKPPRVKIDKRLWDRNPDTIRFEHQLIEGSLSNSFRWINIKTKIRYIRNALQQKTNHKPSYHAVYVHFLIYLSQHEHKKNKKGQVKLIKIPKSPYKPQSNIIFDGLDENDTLPELENEIDITNQMDADEDVFIDISSTDVFDENNTVLEPLEEDIDINIFGDFKETGKSETVEESVQPSIIIIAPEIIQSGIKLAGYHIEAGSRKFSDFSKAMINDLGKNIEPFLRSFYETIRYYPGFSNDGMSSIQEIDEYISSTIKTVLSVEQEQKFLHLLTNLMGSAFKLGHYKFKDNAKFVYDSIREDFGDEVAELIKIDYLQASYIGMSIRYQDTGEITPKTEVITTEFIRDESNHRE